MNSITAISFRLVFIWCLGLSSSCSLASDRTVFVGCTPGNELIKFQLGIPKETTIDFIKWNLAFDKLSHNSFVLNIIYGESQPNTLGFKQGGQKKSYHGEYHIFKDNGNEIYELKSGEFQTEVLLMKLNANMFHLLTPLRQLMVGNGGWSYTLNNENPDRNDYPIPTLPNSTTILSDTSFQIIYDGRTPCQDFASENDLTVNQSCFKLKWKLVLSKDPITLQPTTYALKRTNSRETDITGIWTISKGLPSNPNAIVLQLDPDKPNRTISLLVGDDNVLFFLHKNKNLFVGNENFSYTLNKRQNPIE